MLERLACKLGRNDEEPNIDLAVWLCDKNDAAGVREIAGGLLDKDKAVASDCIKVLYEIGYRKPELIAPYAVDFVANLLSKNNRLAWGSMIALGTVADLSADEVFPKLEIIVKAYKTGSVITMDNGITVFAKLCKADGAYSAQVFPIILEHLRTCRPKEIPQHSERAVVGVDASNAAAFIETLRARKNELTVPQMKRVDKVIKTADKLLQ